MEQYKRKLKLQNILLAIGAIILIMIQVLAYLGLIAPAVVKEHWANFWNGFIAGSSMGLCVLFLIGIIINIRALRNESRLKRLYIKENDERAAEIQKSSKSTGVNIFLFAALLAGIVAGYFSITVFITILACDVVLSLIICGSKLYYSHAL